MKGQYKRAKSEKNLSYFCQSGRNGMQCSVGAGSQLGGGLRGVNGSGPVDEPVNSYGCRGGS